MRLLKLHRSVWIWYDRWIAVQIVWKVEIALGVACHWRRLVLDVYLGPLTIAIGDHPLLTDPAERARQRCRGFVLTDQAVL